VWSTLPTENRGKEDDSRMCPLSADGGRLGSSLCSGYECVVSRHVMHHCKHAYPYLTQGRISKTIRTRRVASFLRHAQPESPGRILYIADGTRLAFPILPAKTKCPVPCGSDVRTAQRFG
jgi:hypothetical protein